MSKIFFKIFVTGLNSRNKELIATFRQVCDQKLVKQQYQIEVVDILKDHNDAEKNKILATPTIIRQKPLPERRIIGNFKENNKAVKALNFLTEDFINQK
jgi:circadian clock protein KaiB